MAAAKPKAVVLDFGGVLVEIHGHKVANALKALAPAADSQAWHGIAAWKAHHDYECGRMSTADFCRQVSERVSQPLQEADFTRAWNEIFGPVVAGIEPVLREISAAAPLYLLSNTNEAHWRHIGATYAFMTHFRKTFTSFELGARKPEAAIFAAAARHLGLPPGELLFIDDLPANVDGARAAGLQAEVCLNSAARLRAIMMDYGVLAAAASVG